MKLITFTVPCYNSAAYMSHCVETLLPAGEEAEIILVDDGSKDDTGRIADEFAEKYPDIVRVIHQENGGHGEGVNQGIRNARGVYFKVVDSDDWLDTDALQQVMATLRAHLNDEKPLDLLMANYVYEHVADNTQLVVDYKGILPVNRVFGWQDIGHFPQNKNILMHSVIYRTEVLRACKLELPKHTFYVDNIFAFNPLPYVKKIYYIDTNFYRYYIGRADQSVNEKVMIGRVDQQIKVNKLMVDYLTTTKITNRKTYNYMVKYLDIITTVSSIMLIRARTEEAIEKKEELWAYIRQKNPKVFLRLRYGLLGNTMNLPGRSGRRISEFLYRLAQKVMKFN